MASAATSRRPTIQSSVTVHLPDNAYLYSFYRCRRHVGASGEAGLGLPGAMAGPRIRARSRPRAVADGQRRGEGEAVSIRGKAFIAGVYEHPLRVIPDRSTSQIHAEVAAGAVADAGLSFSDVDAYFCDASAGFGPISMADYMGLRCVHVDSTETGGSSPVVHVGHAAESIAAGKCQVALITLAGRPRSAALGGRGGEPTPDLVFEGLFGMGGAVTGYALAAQRHMHEFGTTSEQLAHVKVAASLHAQHNPHAFLQRVVTVEEVLESPMISTPLRRHDCCVVTDGGGAVVVVSPEVARDLDRTTVKVLGHGEAVKHADNGRIDLTYTGGVVSGPRAFEEAGVLPGRHRLRLHLRLLHDHGGRDPRGPRVLRQGRGRPIRPRRHARRPARTAALQHRRWRPVQQPPLQPGRR